VGAIRSTANRIAKEELKTYDISGFEWTWFLGIAFIIVMFSSFAIRYRSGPRRRYAVTSRGAADIHADR